MVIPASRDARADSRPHVSSRALDFPFAITAEMKGDLVSRIGEFYDTRSLVS